MDSKSIASREKQSTGEFSGVRKTAAYHLTRFSVRILSRTGIPPDTVTWSGFIITLGAAALIITGHLFAAGFVVLVAGFFDMLDGALARSTGRITRFGGILDSTLDRLSEAALLLSVLFVYASGNSVPGLVLVGLALVGSLMVSYIRARAEALDLQCEIGLFTRPERVIVLALGLLFSRFDYALTIALVIIVVFSFITVLQRIFNVWRQTKKSSNR